MRNHDPSNPTRAGKVQKVPELNSDTAACKNKRNTIKAPLFFATFLIVGLIGFVLSLMFGVKSMQVVSVFAICIGFFYLTVKPKGQASVKCDN